MRLHTGHNRLNAHMLRKMKLSPSPASNCGLEDQTAEHNYTAEMPASADSKNKCVANSSPATHQTLRQQGGTGEDGHIYLADWTLSVAAIEKKKSPERYWLGPRSQEVGKGRIISNATLSPRE